MKMTAELVKVMSQGHAQDGDKYGERSVHIVSSGRYESSNETD